MKRILASITAVITLALPIVASSSSWSIDPDHSNVGFKARHLIVSNVNGNFGKYSGTFNLNEKNISKSHVQVTIDTTSINTNMQKRDDHLKSVDFLDVAAFPTMTFVSKKIAKVGKNRLKVTGYLTLHGITRQVKLDMEALSKESKDPWGNIHRGTTAITTINRKDFGLAWNKALETGDVMVGDDITITLDIEMIKDKDNSAMLQKLLIMPMAWSTVPRSH